MTESTITLYHNPRCSKSREALKLLNDNGITLQIIEYLKDPLDETALRGLLNLLQLTAESIIRKQDSAFKALDIDDQAMDDNSWFHLLLENPGLMQRPIVANQHHAIIARPPERVLEFLQNND